MMGKKSFIGLVSIAIIVAAILIAQDGSRLFLDMSGGSGSYTYNIMFNSGLGFILAGVGLGILFGAVAGNFMRMQAGTKEIQTNRIGMEALLDDWGIALSTLGALILLISGILLGGTWSPRLVGSAEATGFVMNVHFFGMVTLLFGGCYLATRMLVAKSARPLSSIKYLFRLGKESRYLPSHKLAVLTFLVVIVALVVKGAGLIAVHAFGWAEGIAVGTAVFHDIFALGALVLLIAAISFRIVEKLGAQEVVVAKPSKAAV